MSEISTPILDEKYLKTLAEAERALADIQLPAKAQVLDIGTGKGYFAISLAQLGFTVTTGEPCEDDGLYARQPWRELADQAGVSESITFQGFNASHMPFTEERFAAVFAFGVLHHIAEHERQASLSEALRVTQKGGAIIIFEPTKAMLEDLWQRDPHHPLAADPDLYRPEGLDPAQRFPGKMMDMMIYRKG